MNLRCKVCGEKAAGFHFGAFTCEGCKSFFGRCCNNMSIIGECRNNKECIIDKKNRTSCKACRLQKCLLVGMSKSGSRYGRRSNWFKQYFQENEFQNKNKESHRKEEFPISSPKVESYRSAFTEIGSQKKPFDLCSTQPLISSHLYLNYFPHLGLNRLVSCKQAIGDNTILLSNSVPFSLLKNETHMNDYFDKLLITKYDNAIVQNMLNSENPLDLSRKASNKEAEDTQEFESEFSKKTLPLDLSVK